jgi:SpoVK/Ycf46/Vps4 family AAA+-type ATPase
LTQFEAGSVILSAIVATREFSDGMVPFIVKEKAQIIRKSGVLEYYDQTVTMDQVGGLIHFKEYAEIKRAAFSVEARAAGVDAPKGVLLVGVPGTGKSLVAKAMAGGKMPLLRMDFGALLAGLVGKSEENLRLALKVAEATSPCVLWIDEIEKALGGGGELDGGTAVRMLGSLLTWMQETTAPVYVFATANNVQALKPELLRRFDDIMWVDLPCRADRLQVFNVHLSKRNRVIKSSGHKWEALLDTTWGFSGAEIEKVVKSAIERVFAAKKDLTIDDLLDAASTIVPISVTMENQITNLRSWAATRAIPASDPLEQKPQNVKAPAKNLKADLL